ncbi:MAG: M3 family metallopeptidase [Alphaproteobacteria bacterium]
MAKSRALKDNPLVKPPATKHGTPPFSAIEVRHFIPAIDWAVRKAKKDIEAIKKVKSPTFENVIEAMEKAGSDLGRIMGVYSNWTSTQLDDAVTKIQPKVSAKMTDYSAEINFDKQLFKLVKAVHDKKDSLGLDGDQMLLLEDTYKGFVRSGALLTAAKQRKLKKINTELSEAAISFGNEVLKDTNDFVHFVDDEADLAGLPQASKDAAAALATEKGEDGKWAFSLQAPSYLPIMQFAENRALRETMYRASGAKGSGNAKTIKKIVKLRHDRATLLGYKDHSDYVLSERMAGDVGNVRKMMKQIEDKAGPVAEREHQELLDFMAKNGGPSKSDVKQWDLGFWAEKQRKAEYGFDSEALRPYFEYDNVEKGAFDVAGKLFGIEFKEATGYDKYDPTVKTFEVFDTTSGDLLGVVYTDYFPRKTKRGGAWMSTYRDQGRNADGSREIPIVCLHGNFTPPGKDGKALLSLDEVNTFFHELGHGLHGLLSDTRYRSQAGTNVKWDFVELPSQLMENFLGEKKVLDSFATHHETGKKIPKKLYDAMKKADLFRRATGAMRQMSLGTLDLAYHTAKDGKIGDIETFENKATARFSKLPPVPGVAISGSFSHIFAGGYSSGYYSYKWAEVLDADAYEAFTEEGLKFDRSGKLKPSKTSAAFRKLMATGGSKNPMDIYQDFRGHKPDASALLRRDGLLPKNTATTAKKDKPADKTPPAPK